MRRNHGSSRLKVAPLLAAAVLPLGATIARADLLQNQAISGTPAALNAAGFNLNGAGVSVADLEAAGALANSSGANLNTSPNSTLPNGNPDLPAAQVNLFQLPGGVLPANGTGLAALGLVVDNHASEVTGVIVGQGANNAADIGLSPGAVVQEGGSVGPNNSLQGLTQQALMLPNTSIVNLSLGANSTQNNGSSTSSLAVDWEAGRFNGLIVVAGNEGSPGTPSDAFNILNVAATGVRVGATLSYNALAPYNTSNATLDGRIGVNLVAPGGDPAAPAGLAQFNAIPAGFFTNQFQSTAGGQYEFQGITAGNAVYNNDALSGVTSANSAIVTDTGAPKLAGPPLSNYPLVNPGAALGGTDSVQANPIAGTSFAAPTVAAAGALLTQYANVVKANPVVNPNFAVNNTDPIDHRVLKAILMNGASKTNVDGTQLMTAAAGGRAWQSAPSSGGTVMPPQFSAIAPVKNGAITGAAAGQFPTQPGLDPLLGTGQLNVVKSLLNYAAGEQGPGNVRPIGWDLDTVNVGFPQWSFFAYNFTTGPGTFEATLDWDSPVSIANAGPNNTFLQGSILTRTLPTNLDLYIFSTNGLGGALVKNFDFSTSLVDNDEHLYVPNLPAGTYQIDVVDADAATPNAVTFGLAWSVPEPATLWIAAFVPFLMRRRRSCRPIS